MKFQTKLFNVSLALVVALLLVPATLAAAAAPPQPTYDTAIVDGNYGEWDLTNDFFADMYRAANTNKKVESKLYLRYDCETETLYALVLGVAGVPVLAEPDNAFVKIDGSKVIDGNSGNDGTPPDFAWIDQGFDGNSNHARGFEASFSLASQATYDLNVHVNVDDGGSQTSAVADRSIELVIFCPPDPTAVELASFEAAAQANAVALNWETASEIDSLGFNIYRATSADGPRFRLNGSLIAAQSPGSLTGASYQFIDRTVRPGATYFYWLEAVDIAGSATYYGPTSVQLQGMFLPARPRLAIGSAIIGNR